MKAQEWNQDLHFLQHQNEKLFIHKFSKTLMCPQLLKSIKIRENKGLQHWKIISWDQKSNISMKIRNKSNQIWKVKYKITKGFRKIKNRNSIDSLRSSWRKTWKICIINFHIWKQQARNYRARHSSSWKTELNYSKYTTRIKKFYNP